MLIPKTVKKEVVHNPIRPKTGIPRSHTVCRLSWSPFYEEENVTVDRIMVDADHIDEFVAELEQTIPKEDRYRCVDQEMWLVDKKWKRSLVDIVKKYFDKVDTNLRKWD